MVALPRLVVAAPASGHGKTTVATGLMAALARAGHTVSGHKVGPDYIDPGYHALATGRPGRNLDPHLVGEERLVPLLLHGAAGADLAVIEGVMGLYDGQIGADGFASTAHVAAVTRSPVVLVVDISSASRTIAATIHGLRTWAPDPGRPPVDVVGVVLNKAGSARHADEVVRSIGDQVPVLGILQRDDGIEAPSRHLGLVPAAERADAAAALDRLAAQIAERVDLEQVVRLARAAPGLDGVPWSPSAALGFDTVAARPAQPAGDGGARPAQPASVSSPSVEQGALAPVSKPGSSARIAVAGGRAFTFRYAETVELLRAAGAEVVELDPLTDTRLPEGTTGLYLGGGFPEMHAAELGANDRLRRDLRTAVARGLPTVAECAGLLYLCESVQGPDGTPVPMVGAIGATAEMAPRLTLAYRTATAATDNLLARVGEQVTGHEFHRTHLTTPTAGDAAWLMPDPAGVATPSLHASYLHTHWAGHPQLAARFVAAAAAYAGPDLRHHGDKDTGPGLVDLAVNVFDGPRPAWLDRALADSLADADAYPDPSGAERAVAQRHGREPGDVLATAGAAEAFTLLARLRPWRHPVVVHPQFTEPEVALRTAGHTPDQVVLRHEDGFRLDPDAVPDDADLVVIGNPTNPTGVRHPATAIRDLARPERLVVIDEAFLDDDVETLADERHDGLVVLRSLTKIWAIPGIRAGYVLAEPEVVRALRDLQTPWSVSAPAIAALVATSSEQARDEARRRAAELERRRRHLEDGLRELGIETVPSTAPYVLARTGTGSREALRGKGFAVRRADTFPGLGDEWVRISARRTAVTDDLLGALGSTHPVLRKPVEVRHSGATVTSLSHTER
ncbi:cobyrinate a,c-diamide synthase [Nocardioides eburneiflavus]|uniref:Hydrogenobyrinate a,c-diamide synthase n=1 Tax=Nocardioides eburneiflavus TaxID=2518372 RepID=A0A4Z1CM61_9ACTN|nr:cobyrinate a,c-diamide synthase [Nocardioides eburneiflavus]TGN63549.1 cobyrinate a,c-diamide synthase [Nocardioides eburneiflavus]